MNVDDVKVLEIKDSINFESASYSMDEFIKFTRNLQIKELETYLNKNEYDEEKLQTDKYVSLAVLRDIFTEFRKLGDHTLEYYKSSCHKCELNKNKTVHIFEGTISKEHFGFIPVEEGNPHMGIHFCFGFTDRNGLEADNYYHFMFLAAKKMAEFKKRGISS